MYLRLFPSDLMHPYTNDNTGLRLQLSHFCLRCKILPVCTILLVTLFINEVGTSLPAEEGAVLHIAKLSRQINNCVSHSLNI